MSEFQKLTDLDKVDAIYSEFTPTTVAIAPLSNIKGVPVIYAAAAASSLTSLNGSDDELQSNAVNIQFFVIQHTTRYRSAGQNISRSGTFTLTFTSALTRKYVIYR